MPPEEIEPTNSDTTGAEPSLDGEELEDQVDGSGNPIGTEYDDETGEPTNLSYNEETGEYELVAQADDAPPEPEVAPDTEPDKPAPAPAKTAPTFTLPVGATDARVQEIYDRSVERTATEYTPGFVDAKALQEIAAMYREEAQKNATTQVATETFVQLARQKHGEFFKEHESGVRAALLQLPEDLRITERSVRVAMQIVIDEESERTGDMAGALERAAKLLRGTAPAPPAAPKPKAKPVQIPPNMRVPSGGQGDAPKREDDDSDFKAFAKRHNMTLAEARPIYYDRAVSGRRR